MPKPPRPSRPQILIPGSDLSVVVCDDGSRTLRCHRQNVTWHSESGALAESKLVFLKNSGIEDRINAGNPSTVLEVGFGTGLNFLLTASQALGRQTELMYLACEPNPLCEEALQLLEHQNLDSCRAAFEHFYPFRTSSFQNVSLELVHHGVQQFKFGQMHHRFDAIFHDAFSPEVAPELWEESLFFQLCTILKPGGKLVTYCVKSEVQRRLKNAGFTVSKTRGPVGGKREVLIATK